MPVMFLTTDLLFASRVAGAAQRQGRQLETVGSVALLLEKAAVQAPELVIIDLSLPGIDPAQLVPALREITSAATRILAFGPHVHEQRLQAATAAGCNDVMLRGQFNAQIDAVLLSVDKG